MRAFIISKERLFILQLIYRILDFKFWVLGCLKDGLKMLVGHTDDMHMFRFFVDLSGWAMMQYKVSPIDLVWSLVNGPPIRLWKTNLDNSPKLPIGVPNLVLYRPIWGNDASRSLKKEKFISSRVSKYMDFGKVGIAQNSTYEMKMKLYVEYWEMFCCICQDHYCFKVQFFWRASNLRIIRGLTLLGLHCQL